ncbi:hypothetical protein DPX16_6492 [Anabarilius grahami]|uniref:Uncharacterized protein n=1 Tax=Anabarilius grahami TaxID=495550 RepID=A0A3N0YCU1_ANAGA|nr:hypothetical protein DPX16_6492 [Anabarilius grahami]
MFESAPTGTTEQNITMEPEQRGTDQVCELAAPSVAEGILVECEGNIGHSALVGSLGTSAPPGSDIVTPPLRTCGPAAALWPSTPSATASSALPQDLPPPSVAPTPPLPSRSLLPPRGGRRCGSVAVAQAIGVPLRHRLSGCAVGSTFHVIVASSHPHGGVIDNIAMATPLAVAWIGHHLPLLKAPPWLTPPSSPPWTLVFRLLPVGRPPPEPPPTSSAHFFTSSSSSPLLYGTRMCLPGGGVITPSRHMNFQFCFFSSVTCAPLF